jgi:3'(2'), 5'-bisphosphate nucleotidase
MLEKLNLHHLVATAREAGDVILEIYANDFSVEMKENKTPLTEADKKSNDVILLRLQEYYPGIPFISEESKTTPFNERKNWDYYWLIDPLDGTKEFIKKNGEFTVNIALMKGCQPVAGIVYAPALNLMYVAKQGEGSFKVDDDKFILLGKQSSYKDLKTVRVVASRSHNNADTDAFIEALQQAGKKVELVSSGSSLKFCLVAEGKADVYPRFGPTMEWDTAAGQAIAEIAGAKVLEAPSLKPLTYNKENLLNPFFIVEW